MAHALRKYISNRGSALFMVISTMTALMVACMAMYFSVVSSRSTQYAVFNQQQSYQSAMSIADMVMAELRSQDDSGNPGVLFNKMNALNKGQTITSETGTADQVGDYVVTITCLDDTENNKQFDVSIAVTVNGVSETIHHIISANVEEKNTPGGMLPQGTDSDIFSATGYVPNDSYINGGYYLTDVFYDCEYTYFDIYSSGENRIARNLATGGSFELGSGAKSVVESATESAISSNQKNMLPPVTWAIRGDLIIGVSNKFQMRGGSNIYVGGDCIVNNGGGFFDRNNSNYGGNMADVEKPISVYVNGDLILNNGDMNLNENISLYVKGNIILKSGNINGNPKIYGTDKMTYTGKPILTLDKDVFNSAMQELNKRTATMDFYKWDVSGGYTGNTKQVNIKLDSNTPTFVLAKTGSESANLIGTGKAVGVVADNFDITSIDCSSRWGSKTILIDTGEDENTVVTIKANANCKSNSSLAANDTFMWFPGDSGENTNGRNVLVKGRGTVIIDVPEGVAYQDVNTMYVMHYGWWRLLNNRENIENGLTAYNSEEMYQPRSHSSKVIEYIHTECKSGDGCSYTTSTNTTDCASCGGKRKDIICGTHGRVTSYCPACEPSVTTKIDNGTNGFCKDHIEKGKIKSYVNSLPATSTDGTDCQANWKDKNGNIIYPTTNIFLVSCDESAKMNFAQGLDNNGIGKNSFFGFVYAPYITYMAEGGNNTGYIKLCGGMIVSDYVLQGTNSFIRCYPDRMPNEIMAAMGTGGNTMAGFSSKSWKVNSLGF